MVNEIRRFTKYVDMPKDGWTIQDDDGKGELTVYPAKIIDHEGRKLIFQQRVKDGIDGRVYVTVPGFVVGGEYGIGVPPFIYDHIKVEVVLTGEMENIRKALKNFATGEIDFWV